MTAVPRPTRFNAKDFMAGALMCSVASIGQFVNRGYEQGTAADMGPGYMPLIVFIVMAALGAVIVATSFRTGPDPLERWAWRELILVLGAMTAFALLIERAGLGISVITTVLIGGVADRTQTLRGLVITAVALALISWAVFILGLGLNIPFLPT